MKKSKREIVLQVSASEYQKMKVKSIVFKNLLPLLIILTGIFLTSYSFKKMTSEADRNGLIEISEEHPYVSDNAQVLSEQVIEEVQKINDDFNKTETKPQLMIITVDKIPEGESIESFTNQAANDIGVGNSLYDNGVVYLIAVKDRKARLEVGYGLEPVITDSMVDEITDDVVKDAYRSDDYSSGVQIVSKRISHLITYNKLPVINAYDDSRPKVGLLNKIWLFLAGLHLEYWILVISFLITLYFLWDLQDQGKKIAAQIVVIDMVTHYLQDINKLDKNNNFDASVITDEKSEAYKAAREQLEKSILLSDSSSTGSHIPEYYDMDFAFGQATPLEFVNEYVSGWKKLEKTTMADFFWRKNARKLSYPHFWIGEGLWAFTPESFLPLCRVSSVSENIILTPVKFVLYPLSTMLRHPFLTVMVVYFFVNMRQASIWTISYSFLTAANNVVEQLDFFLILTCIYFFVVFFVVCAHIQSIGDGIQNRLRLDTMIRAFLKDLRAIDSDETTSIEVLADQLDKKQLDDKKEKLKKIYSQKRLIKEGTHTHSQKNGGNKLPDYYDMKFAYGSVTIAAFLGGPALDRNLKTKSMYINHSSWSSSSNNSSGGDGFGGGSFGGGGGTSSW